VIPPIPHRIARSRGSILASREARPWPWDRERRCDTRVRPSLQLSAQIGIDTPSQKAEF